MVQLIALAVVALTLIIWTVAEGGWSLLLLWPAGNLLIVAWAYAKDVHGIFGKRRDGTLCRRRTLFFFPFLFPLWTIWHVSRVASPEPAVGRANESLVVGRRLLSSELAEDYDNYVDLTAEFSAPKSIRELPGYHSFPILDASAPDPVALRSFIKTLRPGRTFVHCAQGHGRTGLFALAMLLEMDQVKTVDEGLQLLWKARPGIRLNRNQERFVRRFADSISS